MYKIYYEFLITRNCIFHLTIKFPRIQSFVQFHLTFYLQLTDKMRLKMIFPLNINILVNYIFDSFLFFYFIFSLGKYFIFMFICVLFFLFVFPLCSYFFKYEHILIWMANYLWQLHLPWLSLCLLEEDVYSRRSYLKFITLLNIVIFMVEMELNVTDVL